MLTIEVLVAAPRREVDSPLVQPQRHIAHRVCQVPAHHAASRAARGRDWAHLEALSGVVLDTRQEEERYLVTARCDECENLRRRQRLAPLARAELDDGLIAAVPAQRRVRADGDAVGREGAGLDDNLVALFRRRVERRHEQVQVHRQRVHRDDLQVGSTNKPRKRRAYALVVAEPVGTGEVAALAQCLPELELLAHERRRGRGHEAKRVATQVDVDALRHRKVLAERRKLVRRIEDERLGEVSGRGLRR